MFEHKNVYPVILVPGFFAYGEGTLLDKTFPYFGTISAKATDIIKSMGMDCHTADFCLLSSVWDRACELYAQIVGGTVDYGEVHSKKHGHEQFGKTYEKGFVENWGSIDENSEPVKITLIAKGFGVAVARVFLDLINNGNEEERAAGSTNPLFLGGKKNHVHCLVSLAGINDGVTLMSIAEQKIKNIREKFVKGFIVAEEIKTYKKFTELFDFSKKPIQVTQYGFCAQKVEVQPEETNLQQGEDFLVQEGDKSPKGKKKKVKSKLMFDEDAIARYIDRTEDNVFYDLEKPALDLINARCSTFKDTYYICAANSVTTNLFGKINVPTLKAGLTFPTAFLIARYENYLPEYPIATAEIQENDGVVNTSSSLPPLNEPIEAYKNPDSCKPGVWNMTPIQKKSHLAYRGVFVRPDKYTNQVYDLMKIICNLNTV
ncbi:MAG: hypothetical protein GX241_03655 [Ruminococcaceae bacterium]|nr:hypothetical protein [Oscillospiraceae bacterium]